MNNNNEYLERLTHTGPKRLHVHGKYTVKIQCIQHECTHMSAHTDSHMHACAHTHTHTHTNTHTHTPVTHQGNETEEKEKGFQGRFKRADRSRMADKNRELVPDNWSLVRESVRRCAQCRRADTLFKDYQEL